VVVFQWHRQDSISTQCYVTVSVTVLCCWLSHH